MRFTCSTLLSVALCLSSAGCASRVSDGDAGRKSDADDWLAKLPSEPASLEITLRFRAGSGALASEAAVVALLGEKKPAKHKHFKVEYFEVPAAGAPAPIWRRRSELADPGASTPLEVRLDFKLRASSRPEPAKCDPGWTLVEDTDATRKSDGATSVTFSTGCERTSSGSLEGPANATRTCAARMTRATFTTTALGDANGKVRLETWSIGGDTILELSAQADTVEERATARRTFDAAAALLSDNGVKAIDDSKTELTLARCASD
ncbi:MAG: hypothetical protein U0271_28140 [Polyangiaceae bacterium]